MNSTNRSLSRYLPLSSRDSAVPNGLHLCSPSTSAPTQFVARSDTSYYHAGM